ncbi:hypothetical protein B0H17DRAFT_968982 [Mycena rosella]|uniref:Uncharacterized protein n=1 Tax=Mycena rosella TaxID=1033263 RepID=A0AAD7F7Y0_MYCRO|nr:hypothetical protein B0H17DRAFT_968982 [Mycena rosella]
MNCCGVYRVWRYLVLRRRTGQAQNIDAVITNRGPGSLAVRCPACPEVGFNIKRRLDTVPADKGKREQLLETSGT